MISSININNTNIRYAKLGSGTKIFVMLPGVFLTSVVDNCEAVEKAYVRFLDEYTIYLFDYKFIQKNFSIKTFSDYFYQIFKKLDLENMYLFAVSMGWLYWSTIIN